MRKCQPVVFFVTPLNYSARYPPGYRISGKADWPDIRLIQHPVQPYLLSLTTFSPFSLSLPNSITLSCSHSLTYSPSPFLSNSQIHKKITCINLSILLIPCLGGCTGGVDVPTDGPAKQPGPCGETAGSTHPLSRPLRPRG